MLVSRLREVLPQSLYTRFHNLSPLMQRVVALAALAFTIVMGIGIALRLRSWAPDPPSRANPRRPSQPQNPPPSVPSSTSSSTPSTIVPSSPPSVQPSSISPRASEVPVEGRNWKECLTPSNAVQVLQDLLKVAEVEKFTIIKVGAKDKHIPEECAQGLLGIEYFRLNGNVWIEKKGDRAGIYKAYKALKKFVWSKLWQGQLLAQVLRAPIFGDHQMQAQRYFITLGRQSVAISGLQADIRVNGRKVEYSLTQIFKGVKYVEHGVDRPPYHIVRRQISFEVPEGLSPLNIPQNPVIEDTLSPELPSLEKALEFWSQQLLMPPKPEIPPSPTSTPSAPEPTADESSVPDLPAFLAKKTLYEDTQPKLDLVSQKILSQPAIPNEGCLGCPQPLVDYFSLIDELKIEAEIFFKEERISPIVPYGKLKMLCNRLTSPLFDWTQVAFNVGRLIVSAQKEAIVKFANNYYKMQRITPRCTSGLRVEVVAAKKDLATANVFLIMSLSFEIAPSKNIAVHRVIKIPLIPLSVATYKGEGIRVVYSITEET